MGPEPQTVSDSPWYDFSESYEPRDYVNKLERAAGLQATVKAAPTTRRSLTHRAITQLLHSTVVSRAPVRFSEPRGL